MRIGSSLRFSLLDRYSGLVINFVVSLILARLLTPDELGVFSLTMVILTIAQTMRDMGAGTYIIQEPDLTTERIRAAWTVQLAIGCSIALLVLILAHPLALFYDDMRMRTVLWLLALNFAVNPVGAITVSWLLRHMEFKKIAIVRFCGAIVGGSVSIGFAMKDFGPASLALGSLATTLTSAMLVSRFRPSSLPWRPGTRELGRVLSIGTKLTGIALFNSIAKATPEASLGRFQGMTDTGLYARATGLISLFDRLVMDALNSIMLPTFSAFKRENRDPTETFVQAFSILTALGYCFFLGLAFLSDYVILILYGEQWLPASKTATILCLNGAFALPIALAGPLMVADGRIKETFIFAMLAGVLTIGASVYGAYHGLTTLASALSAATFLNAMIWLRSAHKSLSANFWKTLLIALRSAIIAALTCAPLLSLPAFDPGRMLDAPWRIVLTIAASLGTFVIVLRLLNPASFRLVLQFFRAPAPLPDNG